MASPRIQIACSTKISRFDLALHDSEDLVVRGWKLEVTDAEGQLCRTEFLGSTPGPNEVLRWLEPMTGSSIALELVERVKEELAKKSITTVAV
jgi:hypothetical protein